MRFAIASRAVTALAVLLLAATIARAQTTQVTTEYLMTLEAPLDRAIRVDSSMVIVPVNAGGWVKGPKINGTFVSPGGDWIRIMPSGAARLDVRALIRTDDNAHIFVSYNGIAQHSKESAERSQKGETLKTEDMPYFVTAPTFQTSAEQYAWLNRVQAVAKMVELKSGENGYVRYDVFIVR